MESASNLDAWIDMPIPQPLENEFQEIAWGINKIGEHFQPIKINRGKVGENDVKFEMLYCGICHTDVHFALNHLGGVKYPIIPGHELVGKVTEVGKNVSKFQVGDVVGAGVMCESCLNCDACKNGEENYCLTGYVHIYDGLRQYGICPGNPDTQTFGGYSGSHVLNQNFVFKIPEGIPIEKAAPILCAGITMYDPLRHWGATKQDKIMNIGIVGIGGLGTMGIKLAKAMKHRVVAISTSANKKELAIQKGADAFVISTDPESMKTEAGKLDLILNTVSAPHQMSHYLSLLSNAGTLVQLGVVGDLHQVNQMPLIHQRKQIAGSDIGGTKATQECLEFCSQHQIFPDVQIVEANQINWVFGELINNNKDGIRYVIDIEKSKQNKDFI